MELRSFLKENYEKYDLEKIVSYLGLKTTGTKDILINRIIENFQPILKEILLKNFSKFGLERISEKLKLNKKGTVSEIKRRILSSIKFPDYIDESYHKIEVDHKNHEIKKYNYNTEYFLEKYYSKEDLKDILSDNNLTVGGDKQTLIERIKLDINPSLKFILENIEDEFISEICEEMKIERKGIFSSNKNKISLILNKINDLDKIKIDINSLSSKVKSIESDNKSISFKELYNFLDTYNFISEVRNSNTLERELFEVLVNKFGKKNVNKQVLIRRGRIDFEVFDIGIELKTIKEGFSGELDRMIGQIKKYKESYNENLILIIVNENSSSKDLESYLGEVSKEGIQYVVKDY
jgi:hypothetical protein